MVRFIVVVLGLAAIFAAVMVLIDARPRAPHKAAEPVAKAAPPPPGGKTGRPSLITNPDWAEQPSPADLTRAYPPEALRRGLGGKATIRCTVTAKGKLADCEPVSEEPAGYGFGAAAMSMTPHMKMRPQLRDGVPVGGAKVSIPIVFNPR